MNYYGHDEFRTHTGTVFLAEYKLLIFSHTLLTGPGLINMLVALYFVNYLIDMKVDPKNVEQTLKLL